MEGGDKVPERDAATSPETATWSTHAVDADAAVDYWRSVRRQAYVDVAPSPYDRSFSGEISYADYGDFALSVKRASGEKVRLIGKFHGAITPITPLGW